MVQMNIGHAISFDEFARAVETIATEHFMRYKKMPPHMAVFKDGVIQYSEIPMPKNPTGSPLRVVGPVVDAYRPEYWAVAFEAWVKWIAGEDDEKVKQAAEEYRKNYHWGDIAEKETKKKECIQIVAESLDGSQHYDRTFFIKRAFGQVKLKRMKRPEMIDSETLPLKGGRKIGDVQEEEEEGAKQHGGSSSSSANTP